MNIGAKIKELRNKQGWSQERLAAKAGVSQVAIRKIEAGITKKSRYINEIAQALGKTAADLDPTLSGTNGTILTKTDALSRERNLPVYGSAEGGAGAIIVSTDPVDYVRRPAPLAEVKDGYGIIVLLDSMAPEFKPGDIVLVHPHLPPIGGESCVFYADDGNGLVRASIKSFVRASHGHWHVEQWNPPKKFTLSRAEWQKCHRVVGKYSRR